MRQKQTNQKPHSSIKTLLKISLLSFLLLQGSCYTTDPSLHPSPDQSGHGEYVHYRPRGQGDGLPGWRVYRGCCPSLALFLSSLDILDLPAHGVPLSGEVFHSQVLVRCGPVQAEHECWGQADEGVTEMGNPNRHRETRHRQPVIQASRNRGPRETDRRGDEGETQDRKVVGADCEPEGQGQGAVAQTTLESRGIFKSSLPCAATDPKERTWLQQEGVRLDSRGTFEEGI